MLFVSKKRIMHQKKKKEIEETKNAGTRIRTWANAATTRRHTPRPYQLDLMKVERGVSVLNRYVCDCVSVSTVEGGRIGRIF